MKNIRRFQRTLFTLLLGINVLIFSNTLNNSFEVALGHAMITMMICGSLLVFVSIIRKSKEQRGVNRVLVEKNEQ